jgi:hypothetical protein
VGLHYGNSGLSRRPAGFKWHAPLDASAERAARSECHDRQRNSASGDFTDPGLASMASKAERSTERTHRLCRGGGHYHPRSSMLPLTASRAGVIDARVDCNELREQPVDGV